MLALAATPRAACAMPPRPLRRASTPSLRAIRWTWVSTAMPSVFSPSNLQKQMADLRANTRQREKLWQRLRHVAAVLVDKRPRELLDPLGLHFAKRDAAQRIREHLNVARRNRCSAQRAALLRALLLRRCSNVPQRLHRVRNPRVRCSRREDERQQGLEAEVCRPVVAVAEGMAA